jgi:hypothetical protein
MPRLAKMRARKEASSDCDVDGSGEDEDKLFRHPDRAKLVKPIKASG